MKFLFIEAKYDGIIKVPKSVIEKLPQTIGLFFTVQFIDSLESIKKDIEKTGRTVKLLKGKKFDGVDAFLYVGDGLFHPKALVLGNEQHVHIWNPVDKKYSVVTKSLMEKEVKRQKAAYSSFLMKENIGVLVSTKSGQSYLQQALKLKEKYPEKNFYYIAFDTIEFDKLEDFPFVDVWVNTACPRIGWDDTKRTAKPMVDLGTVL